MLKKLRLNIEYLLINLGGIPSNVKYLKYHNGLNDKQIADHLGFHEETITRFFKRCES